MSKTKKMIEVTIIKNDMTAQSFLMTPIKFSKDYGKKESKEILQGYGGNVMATKVDVPTKVGEIITIANKAEKCPFCDTTVKTPKKSSFLCGFSGVYVSNTELEVESDCSKVINEYKSN